MDLSAIESFAVTTGIPSLSLVLNAYVSLRKSNVELYFKKLLEANPDFSILKEREDLQRYFLQSIEKVSLEVNIDKIDKWKNAMIHIATDYKEFSFKDNFIYCLESLSILDLVVMKIIYDEKPKNAYTPSFALLIEKRTGVEPPMLLHVFRKLAALNLINEKLTAEASGGQVAMVYGGPSEVEDLDVAVDVQYNCNKLGETFLKFISDVKDLPNY